MNENTRDDDDANSPSRSQQPVIASLPFLEAWAELTDFRPLLLQCLLHPIAAASANVPHLIPRSFLWRRRFVPDDDIVDLDGKVILVTGGNAGLGEETVLQLAKHTPSHIFLAARTPSKGEAAVMRIKRAVPSAKVSFLQLDLSSFESISAAVREVNSSSTRLDILVNNAGIMATRPETTKEGYEVQFGTNYLGHALLTKLLLPTLIFTAKAHNSDVRIVNLSSECHLLAPNGGIIFDKSELDAQGTWVRYGQSKLANILFTRELASRYPSITSVAVHPGVIKTDLYRPSQQTNALVRYAMMTIGFLMMGTVASGSLNQLWAAAGRREEMVSGSYYEPVGSISTGSKYAQDARLARELWDWTEEQLKAHGC